MITGPGDEDPVITVDLRTAECVRLMRSEGRRIFRIALAILHDTRLAEDATQETFLRAWQHWDRLSDVSAASAWLTRICVHYCIRQAKRNRRWLLWPTEVMDLEEAPQLPRSGADIDMELAFVKLTRKQRAVLVLHYQLGYTLDECAAILLCSPGTVRSHLGRGLKTLRTEVSR